jgi:hypothetical protein
MGLSAAPGNRRSTMSVFVWLMVGIALWHCAILVPDRFDREG